MQQLSRKLALLAEVLFALARNRQELGQANYLILSDLSPPGRLVTLRSWVQPPSRPWSQNQWYLQCFLHYRAVRSPGKMYNFGVFRLPSHLGCLDRFQIQHEETLHGGCVLHLGGLFFFLSRSFSYLSMLCPC